MSELKDGIYEIKLVVRSQNNGDGSFSIFGYTTTEEMLADHPIAEKFDYKLGGYIPKPLTQEERDEILNEENDYKNGYLSAETIQLRVENGVISLAKPLRFYAGQ